MPLIAGIGGDAFALFYNAKTQKVTAYLGSGRSPAAISLEVCHPPPSLLRCVTRPAPVCHDNGTCMHTWTYAALLATSACQIHLPKAFS